MPKTIKNQYYKFLTYEKLMEAHRKSKKGKGYRKEIIEFNLKQEEYIWWLQEKLENKTLDLGQVFRHIFLRIFINYSSFAGAVDINIKENL